MRKIIAFYEGPYVGTSSNSAFLVPADLDDNGILDWILDWAWDEHERWAEPEDEDGLEDCGPDVHWEDYDAEKHDKYRAGGGSFEDDFAWQAERM